MKKQIFIIFSLLILSNIFSQIPLNSRLSRNLVGHWTFDDPENLTQATIGNDLELVGTHSAVDGPEAGDGAVNIGVGNFYRCYHDIAANGEGNPEWVNIYTIVMDVKIPQLNQWYCFDQTNYNNINDGDWFINPSGQIGVGDTGYSSYTVEPNEWYRLAISVSLGNHYDYYLDGQLLHNGGEQDFEGRFALYPVDNGNQVLFFADNNSEDNALDVAQIMLFDHDLTATELEELGGFGHEFESPELMTPYLQTPTPNSVYICWHTDGSSESVVEYGISETLGQTETGEIHSFNADYIWHWIQLTDLQPETNYYYRCISEDDTTSIKIFQTQPENNIQTGHIRFIVYGDNRTDSAKHTEIIQAMREKIVELYEENVQEELDLVFNVGDIVTYGWTLSQYLNEYFNPISSLSDEVPFMVSIGNHEVEADYFYDYMKYEDIGGTEGEKYYSFMIGPILYIALNSNTQGNTQLTWLEEQLDLAEINDEIEWIFAFLHHPGHSEVWPDGNTAWVQNYVIPLLCEYEKAEMLFYGHSHNYERGISPDSDLRIILTGGGGSVLDRWGMYGNQTDYPEIHRSYDHYNYVIVDVDLENNSFTAETYTLGHLDLPQENILLDDFYHYRDAQNPETPSSLSPTNEGTEAPILVASPFTADFPLMSSQFQLNDNQHNWTSPIIDETRLWENIYGDTGAPDYVPIDLNENIDLKRLQIEDGILENGYTYYWKVRYRDLNLKWSEWSEIQSFTVTELPDYADFTADIFQGNAPLEVRFTDISNGNVISWEWDLDGDGTIDSNEQDPTWIYTEVGNYTVGLTADFGDEQITETKEDFIIVESVSIEEQDFQTDENYLYNYPNPFDVNQDSLTKINFGLKQKGFVQINIYNAKGQKVKTLIKDGFEAGSFSTFWDGKNENGQNVQSGVYFYKLNIDGREVAKKMVVID